MILLCFLLAALVTMGTTVAGSAFLAQRDLQSTCDSAAVAAADALDPGLIYAGDPDLSAGVPLTQASVAEAVGQYRAGSGAGALRITASTDGSSAVLTCRRRADVPFEAVFGRPDGIERVAVSAARAPGRP